MEQRHILHLIEVSEGANKLPPAKEGIPSIHSLALAEKKEEERKAKDRARAKRLYYADVEEARRKKNERAKRRRDSMTEEEKQEEKRKRHIAYAIWVIKNPEKAKLINKRKYEARKAKIKAGLLVESEKTIKMRKESRTRCDTLRYLNMTEEERKAFNRRKYQMKKERERKKNAS